MVKVLASWCVCVGLLSAAAPGHAGGEASRGLWSVDWVASGALSGSGLLDSIWIEIPAGPGGANEFVEFYGQVDHGGEVLHIEMDDGLLCNLVGDGDAVRIFDYHTSSGGGFTLYAAGTYIVQIGAIGVSIPEASWRTVGGWPQGPGEP